MLFWRILLKKFIVRNGRSHDYCGSLVQIWQLFDCRKNTFKNSYLKYFWKHRDNRDNLSYSFLKASTGLDWAALMDIKLITSHATTNVAPPATAKVSGLISMRRLKFSNHPWIT